MGLTQKISLILSAENTGDAAFNAFINQLGRMGGGADAAGAKLLALARNSDALAASSERLALMSAKAARFGPDPNDLLAGAAAYDKVSLAQQKLTIAQAQAQKVMDGYSSSARAFQKVQSDLAKIDSTVGSTKVQRAQQAQTVTQAGVGVRNAKSSLTTQQLASNALLDKFSNEAPVDADVQLAAQADKVAAAEKKVTDQTLIEQNAKIKLMQIDASLIDLAEVRIAKENELTGIGQLQIDQGIEKEQSLLAQATAAGNLRNAQIEELAVANSINDAQRRQNQLLEEQKALNAEPSALPMLLTAGTAVAAVAAFTGYKASKDALAFQSTEAQLSAATNRPISDLTQVGNAALQFESTGQSQYSATQILQGSTRLLSGGLPVSAIKTILPQEARVAAIFNQPDLTSVAAAVNAEIGYAGTGKNTTSAQITAFLSQLTAAEQNTKADPGEVISALPQLFSGLKGSNISTPDALGLESGLVNATGISPQRIATWLGQLVKTSILKPSPNAIKLGDQIGLGPNIFGQAGLAAFGNDPFTYLQNISDAVGNGPGRNSAIQTLLGGSLGGGGIVAARAFQNLTSGTTMQDSAALSDKFSSSSGNVATATTRLLAGEQQKLAGATNKLGKQFIDLGTAINTVAIPAIVGLADQVSIAVDSVQAFGTGLDDWLKHHNIGDVIPKPVKDVAAASSDFWSTSLSLSKKAVLAPLGLGAAALPFVEPASIAAALYDKLHTSVSGTGVANAVGSFLHSQVANNAGSTVFGIGQMLQGNLDPSTKAIMTGIPAQSFMPSPGSSSKTSAVVQGSGIAQYPHAGVFLTQGLKDDEFARQQMLAKNAATTAAAMNGTALKNNFNTNLANFTSDISGINTGTITMSTADVQKFANKLLAEIKITTVAANLGGPAVARDTATITRDTQQLIDTRNLNAANIAYNNAVTQQTMLATETTNLAVNQTATEDVYNKQLAVIQLEADTGKLKGKDIATANQQAKDTENQGFLGDITAPLSDAQAKFQLALNSGSGINAARDQVNTLLNKQASIPGGPTTAEKNLAVQQTNLQAIQAPLADAQQTLSDAQSSGIGIANARNAVVALLKAEAGPNVHGISLIALNAQIAAIDLTDLQKPMQDAQDAMTLAVNTGVGIAAAQKALGDLMTKQATASHASQASQTLAMMQLDAQGLQRPLADAQAALTIAQNTGVGIGSAQATFLNLSDKVAKDNGQTPNQIKVSDSQTTVQDLQIALGQAQARLTKAQETGKGLVQANNDVATLMAEIAPLSGQGGAILQNATDARNLQNTQKPLQLAQEHLSLLQSTGQNTAAAQAKYFSLLEAQSKIPGGPDADSVSATEIQTQLADLQGPYAEAQARLTLATQTGKGMADAQNAVVSLMNKIGNLQGLGPAQLAVQNNQLLLNDLQGPLAEAQAKLTLAQQNGTGIASATTALFTLFGQEAAIPGGPSAAQNTLNKRAITSQNLSISESAAQANLSLAQGTGFGIDQAEKQLADVYRQEAKDHIISSQQLKLDLFQLQQTVANVVQPGPILVRPTAPQDDLTVAFGGSASRISSTNQASVLEKMLAVLEAQHQADERTIQWQDQQLKQARLDGSHLASIDAKTVPPPKQGRTPAGSSLPLANYRISA